MSKGNELRRSGCVAGLIIFAVTVLFIVGCGGTASTSQNTTSQPPAPLTLSNVAASALSSSGATIAWSTSANGTSQVDYGTSTSYGSSTVLDSTLVTVHSVKVSGLAAATHYNFRVRSKDANGLEVPSGNFTFDTQSAGTPPDTAPPTVSVTSPTSGATVTGIVNLAATASDNVAVVGVQFMVDGAAVGAERTSAPYTFSWNSASSANGSHSVTARARDAAGNATLSAVVPVTVSNVPDTSPPTVSITTPSAGASVGGTVNVSATASDNVGVAGVQLIVDGVAVGSEQTTTPYNFAWNSATVTNGSHQLTARARDAAGNSATSNPVSVTVSNTTSGNNFQARCQAPGVFRCWDFEDPTTTNPHLMPPFGSTTLMGQIVHDVVADGSGALMFTIPSLSGADAAGSFSLNFADDLSQQFGEGQEFYLQYRVRYNDVMINTNFNGSNGFKMHITGEGDRPGFTAFSCTTLELPLQNIQQNGYPWAYHSCGNFIAMQVQIPNTSEFLDQPADGCPHYGNQGFPQTEPPCFKYKANEWITIQQHVKIGHWGQPDSTVEYWAADQGQTSRLMISLSDFPLLNDDPTNAKYGKIWLLTYQTGKDNTQATGTGQVWYDSLIISTQRIPDPDVSTPNAPDLLRAVTGSAAGSISLTWRDNSAAAEQGFRVERCTGEANSCMATPAQFVFVSSVGPNVTSYQDTGLTSGQTYTYRVKAFNSSGDSAYSGGACWNETATCYSQAPAK